MALKPVIDSLQGLPAAICEQYQKKEDSKFHLMLDGAPHGFVPAVDLTTANGKVDEFRQNNLKLIREVEELRPLKTKVAELEGAAPQQKVAELESQLAARTAELTTERAARTEAEHKANRTRVRDSLRTKALSVGALPAAVEMLLDKAEPSFTLFNEQVQAQPNTFSKTKPGELLSIEEWLSDAVKEFPFLFKASTGGGSHNHSSLFGTRSGAKEIVNPTASELGEHAAAIARGELKVVYTT